MLADAKFPISFMTYESLFFFCWVSFDCLDGPGLQSVQVPVPAQRRGGVSTPPMHTLYIKSPLQHRCTLVKG